MNSALLVGTPFHGLTGGNMQRAAFEWRALCQKYTVDHLLVGDTATLEKEVPKHKAIGSTTGLSTTRGHFLRPETIYDFAASDIQRFRAFLQTNQYQVAFFRYLNASRLTQHIKECLPDAKIVVDADMLLSRIAEQAWQQNRSFSNRFFFFESLKVARYERWIFNQPYLFLMSNPDELALVKQHFVKPGAPSQFTIVANVMPEVSSSDSEKASSADPPYILFHGILNSSVNRDAFRFLVEDIYPLLQEHLERHGVRIRVVGRGLADFHRDLVRTHGCTQIDLTGEVDNIGAAVRESLLCLMPLRMGSGTKTRVLEAAAYGKCVVTMPLGAEGLGFQDNELVVCDSAESIATSIARLLEDRGRLATLAANLHKRCIQLYAEKAIAAQLLRAIDEYNPVSY